MAGTSKANLRQTASNVAATLTAAFANAGLVTDAQSALRFFQETRDEVFTDLEKQPTAVEGGYQKRSFGGGGSKGGGQSDPGKVVMNYGKFKGCTIEEVYAMDESKAADYGYDKSGKQYITWLTKNDNNKFLKDKATAFIESKRAATSEVGKATDADGSSAANEDW